jgi:ATP-binding cassette subfamily B protein
MMHGPGGWGAYLRYDESKGQPNVDRRLLLRVWQWAHPYRGRVAVMVLLLLAIAVVELLPPLLYGRLIGDLSNDVLTLQMLNLIALGLLVVPIVSNLMGVAQRQLSATIGEGLIFDLRAAMFRHVQRMSLRFFTDTKTGDIISRFNNDVVGAQGAVTNTIPNLVANVMTLSTTLAIMLRLEWRLTLVALAALPLFLLPTRGVGRILRRVRRDAAVCDARMSSELHETMNVSGALLVRTFGRQADVADRFGRAAGDVRDIGVRRAVIGRWFFLGLGIATAVGTALMYWLGGFLALNHQLNVGLIVTFAAYVGRLYQPFSGLSNIQVEFATSLVSFERVFEYLDLPVEIDERPGAVRLETIRGALAAEDVWFSYRPVEAPDSDDAPERDEPAAASEEPRWALAGVSFRADPGRMIALVGPSGSGKTTVTYLVTRLYDPGRGRITLDGHDLRDLALESLSQHIGMVTQEPYLFHDTVRANLLFGCPSADQAALEEACRTANVHDVIAAMPDGYDTLVGERGYRMSGGEKQRLALARVILKDPTVLVLDEATSHLDSTSEALIQQALQRVMRGRTSLVIAHRLSTVLEADSILVMERGRVVESGTHHELLARGGLYAALFETQFQAADQGQGAVSTLPSSTGRSAG